MATWNLHPLLDELSQDADKARALIDVMRAARQTTGPGRDRAEEKLMQHLAHLKRDCYELFDNATGALNVLVESGVIGECGALARLDDWKEDHLWA